MLILECSKGCYRRTDGSVSISFRNFLGEGIKSGLVCEVASLEMDNVYKLLSQTVKCGLIRRVAYDGNGLIRRVAYDGNGLIRRVAYDGNGLIRGWPMMGMV